MSRKVLVVDDEKLIVKGICFATAMTVASSNPFFSAPARASPLNFSKILFIVIYPFLRCICISILTIRL